MKRTLIIILIAVSYTIIFLPSSVSAAITGLTPLSTYTGEANGDYLGRRLSSAGDVNGNGYDDLIISAYRYNSYRGRVYLFYGGSSISNKDLSVGATADVTFSGSGVAGDQFGISVASGDFNGDGYSDVIIGEYGYGTNQGRAYIYYGDSSMDNSADVTIDGEVAGDYFGISVSSAGDMNNDGWQDFIVGAYVAGPDMEGKAYLYNLNYASPNVSVDAIGSIQITSTEVTGTATQNGVNIGGVEVRIDGGEWMTCNADDGAFDEESEDFTCPLSGLEGGEHTVEVRSYDENGVYIPSSLFATDTFSVDLPETGNQIIYVLLLGLLLVCVSIYSLQIRKRQNKYTIIQ